MKRWPVTDDGRNILDERGALLGEAAQMAVKAPQTAGPLEEALRALPVSRPAQIAAQTQTYYDLPVIKAPPWKWYIPAYFYVGGTAGAASVLSLAAWASRRGDLASLARTTRWLAVVGDGASALLLIADLGKPARFLNMLRVFRPSSPMNLGTWILTASGLGNGAGTVFANGRGIWRVTGKAGDVIAGLLGPVLSTYTAVLLSNTAVPVWARARRSLPILFGTSALASATSLLAIAGEATDGERRVVRALALTSKAGELFAMGAVERDLGQSRVREPLVAGRSHKLWTAAKVLGGASLVATLWPGSSRKARFWAGVLGTAGALAMRFAVVDAGKQSARDPRATFEPQRARLDERRAEKRPTIPTIAAEQRL